MTILPAFVLKQSIRLWLPAALVCLFSCFGEMSFAQSTQLTEGGRDTLALELKPVEISATRCLDAINFAGKLIMPADAVNATQRSLAETLNLNSSIQLNQYGPSGLATVSFMGGGASQTRVFWNGFELNSPALGLFDLSLLPVNSGGISLYTGASSLALGEGGLSGAISISNESATSTGVLLQQTVGSFGQLTSSATATIVKDRLRFSVGGNFGKAENDFRILHPVIRQQYPDRRLQEAALAFHGASLSGAYQLTANKEIEVRLEFQEVDRELPPALFAASSGETQLDRNLRSFARYTIGGRRSRIEISSGLFKEAQTYRNELLELNNRFELLKWDNQFRYSLAASDALQLYFHAAAKFEQFESPGFEHRMVKQLSGSLMGSADYHLSSKWLVKALLRTSLLEGSSPALAPLFEIRYKDSQLEVGLNLARNIRRPTLNDLHWSPGGNPALEPETSRQVMGEVIYTAEANRLNWRFQLNGWWTAYTNQIIWQPGEGGLWSPRNLRETQHRGSSIDVGLSGEGKFPWQLTTGYSYTSATHEGEQLRFVPRHKGYFNASVSKGKLGAALNLVASGQRVSDGGTLDPWATFDCSVNYQLTKRPLLTIEGRLKNITNTYFEMVQNRPMPGRNYTIGLNLNLQKKDS